MMMAAGVAFAGRTDPPDWLETSRKAPMPSLAARTPMVELLEERMLDVSKSETKARVREAFKILTSEGARATPLKALQQIGQGFKLIGGWIVKPDGSASRFDTQEIVQIDADASYEFTMNKVNLFHPAELRVGDTIAWEYELRSKSEAYTESWHFGWTWPTLVSRFGMKLPEGWTQHSTMRNHVEIPAAANDDGYMVWEMRGLPELKSEPMSPAVSDLVPELVVSYAPATGGDSKRVFQSWQSVGRWYADIVATQTVADDTIRQTATGLVAGRTDPVDRIRAVTRFVQGVRYLNVAMGRSTAEPHPAPQILKNRFGDCEDKSVLTITLLKAIGVDAWPMLARTSSIGSLEPSFPAPNQFNHVIVAIKAPAETDFPSRLDGGPLGQVVIFDPTDSTTGLGDLGRWLQGTRAVISHAQHGGLVTLPTLPPDSSTRDLDMTVTFAPAGGIGVKAKVTYTGQYAAAKRWHYGEVRGEKRKEEIASHLASHYGKAEVKSLEVQGVDSPDEPIVMTLELAMPLPGRDLGTMRTMATQFLLASSADILNETERKTPLRIDGGYQETDRLTIELPAGWRALEPYPASEAQSAVGSYSVTASAEKEKLTVLRTLSVKPATVAPADYAPVKKFFDAVARGDASMVGLEKTASP